jgi:hypothetical protein
LSLSAVYDEIVAQPGVLAVVLIRPRKEKHPGIPGAAAGEAARIPLNTKGGTMKQKKLFFLILVAGFLATHVPTVRGQQDTAKGQPDVEYDVSVVINERALNRFIAVVGPVSGKDSFNVSGVKGDYNWKVKNPRIEIEQGRALFVADATVKIGPMSYDSPAKGTVDVNYDAEENRISVKVRKATFEVYTKLFGKKITIENVDISRYYRPEFQFAGPQPIEGSIPVELADGTKKTMYIGTKDRTLRLEGGKITVTSNLVFSFEQPAEEVQIKAGGQ